MNALRTIFRYWLLLMLIAVIVQIGFAGYGAFEASDKVAAGAIDEEAFEDGFGLHAVLGTLLVLGGLLTFLLSLAARVGRQGILHSLGIFVLFVVQLFLGWTGAELPAVLGLLHPINALVILAAIGTLLRRVWMPEVRQSIAPPPPAAA